MRLIPRGSRQERIFIAAGGLVLSWVLRLIGATSRPTFLGADELRARFADQEQVILAFWHGRMVMMPFGYLGRRACIMNSRHRDGALISRAIERFGIEVVHGSSSRGWVGGLKGLLTAAEVMVSIVALEFSYTQAPRTMKSLVLGLFLFAVSLGNLFTAAVNRYIQIDSPSSAIKVALEESTKAGDNVTVKVDHAGYDEQLGTTDDLAMTYNTADGLRTVIPGEAQLAKALDQIERWSRDNEHKLPHRREKAVPSSLAP